MRFNGSDDAKEMMGFSLPAKSSWKEKVAGKNNNDDCLDAIKSRLCFFRIYLSND